MGLCRGKGGPRTQARGQDTVPVISVVTGSYRGLCRGVYHSFLSEFVFTQYAYIYIYRHAKDAFMYYVTGGFASVVDSRRPVSLEVFWLEAREPKYPKAQNSEP